MTQSLEDYLESIYVLIQGQNVVRVKDVSLRMGVKKPSVINALRSLKRMGLVRQEHYGYIEMTALGRNRAQTVLRKHHMLKEYLMRYLGVSEKNAEQDACSMEHFLSGETLSRIGKMVAVSENNGGEAEGL